MCKWYLLANDNLGHVENFEIEVSLKSNPEKFGILLKLKHKHSILK